VGVQRRIPATYFAELAGVRVEMVRSYAKLLRTVVEDPDLLDKEFDQISE
jgi:hypothetical protein